MTHQTLLTNLKLVYIMHEVIAKIYEANSIDDKPQYHKTPHKKSYISINHEVKVLDGVLHMWGSENGNSIPVASFTKGVNPRLAKRPFGFNGRFPNRGLTSSVK